MLKRITLSPSIKEIFNLLNIHSITSNDVNLLDIGKNENTISFISNARLERAKNLQLNPWKELRTEMKLGKFLNNHFPYNEEIIENIVLRYRMLYNFICGNGENIFEIVQGQDIAYWYDSDKYKKGGGSLNSSCMRYERPIRFNLYTGNPDKIKLVILKEDNKLIGRALLWISDDGKLYLDRPYTRYDEDILLYKMYAEKKKIFNYYSENDIKEDFILTVNPQTCQGYLPYLDSMIVVDNRVSLKNQRVNRLEQLVEH